MRAAVTPAVLVRLLLLALVVAVAAVAGGVALGDPGTDKGEVDSRLGAAQGRLDDARAREGVLTSELSLLVGREREARAAVDGAAARLAAVEGRLARRRETLARLDGLLREQTRRLGILDGQLTLSVRRLERRVRVLYMTDQPDLMSFLAGASSFADVLDHVELTTRIGRQDESIAADVEQARDAMRTTRARTRTTRERARRAAALVAAEAGRQRAVTAELTSRRDSLAAAVAERSSVLASVREDKATFLAEVEGLRAESAALAEQIRRQQAEAAAQSPAPATVDGGGALRWPVGGPVTSGFGMRWGRMHEGIDIAVGEGTPVAAAGAGTVITAGWLGGYGNLVVIDHGGGLSTAYGHNSALTVSVGQQVAAGQTIALSGNTGHSTGPHVHFEVRVGGAPVDPLGYL